MDIQMEPFRRAVQKADEWTHELKRELGTDDLEHAWLALGAVLHALRDRLTVMEVAQLGAQLPVLVRGLYFAGWDPGRKQERERRKEKFFEEIQECFPNPDVDAKAVALAVFAVLDAHVSPGELDDVRNLLPKPVRELWATLAERAPRKPAVQRGTATHEIERKEWGAYLSSLSERMRERSVELSIESLALGDQRIARMPLVGISTEEDPTHTAIEVTVGSGRGKGPMLTHVVRNPSRVQVLEDGGTVKCLEIEEEDESKTLLMF